MVVACIRFYGEYPPPPIVQAKTESVHCMAYTPSKIEGERILLKEEKNLAGALIRDSGKTEDEQRTGGLLNRGVRETGAIANYCESHVEL